MATSVEIYQDSADPPEWRWRVKADDTIIGASSEGFSREAYTINNLKSLPKYCRDVDIKTASDDADSPASERLLPLEFYQDTGSEWRWRIKAQNGRIVHASDEGWGTKTEAEDNIRALVVAVNAWTP
jgi:uncharacterized protein YegP (UPF0339 family)